MAVSLRSPVRPRYDSTYKRMLIGFNFGLAPRSFSLLGAAGASATAMWHATTQTVTGLGRALTSSKERSQLHSILGITEVTQEAVASGAGKALVVLGYVSLVLGVINLFPFLPLDGGHILWAVAEKVRGRRVSMAAMWRFQLDRPGAACVSGDQRYQQRHRANRRVVGRRGRQGKIE